MKGRSLQQAEESLDIGQVEVLGSLKGQESHGFSQL